MPSSTKTPPQHEVSRLRDRLVDELKHHGYIRTSRVEAAFRAVPRHLFVPGSPLETVYADRYILTKFDQHGVAISSSSQPAIMAVMLEQLGLEPGFKVLEIGTGTGYNAALMAHIVGETGHVVTIDIDEELTTQARHHLLKAGVDHVQVVCADGAEGYPDAAPYDRIILTVGASDLLPAWAHQLTSGGRLVAPFAMVIGQRSIAFEHLDGQWHSVSMAPCQFMPLRGACARPQRQLGPDPHLVLEQYGKIPCVPDQIYRWLMGDRKDWDTGIEISVGELMWKLDLWLAASHFPVHILRGYGEMVDRQIVPPLLVTARDAKFVATGLFVEMHSMVAFICSPEASLPVDDWQTPFPLCLRQFGGEASLVQRLLASIRAWDQAGRPPFQDLRVRVYPQDYEYAATDEELVIDKPLTRVVLDWQDGLAK